MRILELEIHNVRGIRDLHVKPDGENLLIVGTNGSGKSAVVDAVDFLLTGRIDRLTGPGTSGITLGKHGSHIDCSPDEAWVRGLVRIHGIGEPVEMRRCMSAPKQLVCECVDRPEFQSVLRLADRGSHVLTRRHLLRFVTAEAGERAKQAQSLLNLDYVESIRKALRSLVNEARKEALSAEGAAKSARAGLAASMSLPSFDRDRILETANRWRATLEAPPTKALEAAEIMQSIRQPALRSVDKGVSVTVTQDCLRSLRGAFEKPARDRLRKAAKGLDELLARVAADPCMRIYVDRAKLTGLGLELIGDDGSCPLCDTSWEPGELRDYLEHKLATAQEAKEVLDGIEGHCATLRQAVGVTTKSLMQVMATVETAELTMHLPALKDWDERLQHLSAALQDPLERYPAVGLPNEAVESMLAPSNLGKITDDIERQLQTRYPGETAEQAAWDRLGRLHRDLEDLEAKEDGFHRGQKMLARASVLEGAFIRARDDVLSKLYDSVRLRFEDLYRQVHGVDEAEFTAQLEPAGAGLGFEVDFYGRAMHPPHALHSEGHQDSMGLCLYLALAERLSEGIMDLVVLDDVVMSIDAGHRRNVSELIARLSDQRQFIITTHDRTWMRQLRSAGVAGSRNTVELRNWHIDTGPVWGWSTDTWQQIDGFLEEGNVSAAAASLRRESEALYGEVCQRLGAKVPCKLEAQWDLGELVSAAQGRFSQLLKKAKSVAQGARDSETLEFLQDLDCTKAAVFGRVGSEQWAVNPAVHYNSWANFELNDFRPVVDAFHRMQRLFMCCHCNSLLYVTYDGGNEQDLRCRCGRISWNLASS